MGLSGQLQFPIPETPGPPSITVYWKGANTPDLVCVNSATGNSQPFGKFHVESDRSVSLYAANTLGGALFAGAALLGNSGAAVVTADTWQDFEASFTIALATITVGSSTNTYVTVGGTGWVNGTLVVAGNGTTSLNPFLLPVPTTTANPNVQITAIEFDGNGFIDDLYGIDGNAGVIFPFTGGSKALVTQAVVEPIKRPTPQARVTQGVVEPIKRFVPQALVTQGVVEVIKRGNNSIWQIYEA
jgi:hypothetical protein